MDKEKLNEIKKFLSSKDLQTISKTTNRKVSTIRQILNGNRYNLNVLKAAKLLAKKNYDILYS